MANGYLKINVYNDNIANPVKNANVNILKDNSVIYSTTTDENGQTETITLSTVDKSYTEEEQHNIKPYETYDIEVNSLGLAKTTIKGVQIFDGITSTQNIYLISIDNNIKEIVEEITPNTLWEEYPANNLEEKNNYNSQINPIVLKEVIIPNYIIVHDGIPSNSNAANYNVEFTQYIKNVASSEIYSTWPKETIKANVLAIISFTLNRIYTEWYKSRGYNFTITSSPIYDQKYTRNGTIFDSISSIVDNIFTNYIKKGIRMEPLLAHYKNETNETGYLSQWGSKDLGDKGYTALEILRYYYGNDINIYEAKITDTYPYSFSNTLKENDCSIDIYVLQNSLNYIRGSYPGIPIIKNPSGFYNSETTDAVKTFQKVFSLPQTGEVDYQTWYKISYILTAVESLNKSVYY